LERVKHHGGLGPGAKVFTDIGCGTAKPVFAAALSHPFEVCRGVELLGTLFDLATDIADRYKRRIQPQLPRGDPRRDSLRVELWRMDAFADECDWSDSDLVFANATCFSSEMLASFHAKCLVLKPGAFVAMTTNKLLSSHFQVVETSSLHEDWGIATLYILKKVDPDACAGDESANAESAGDESPDAESAGDESVKGASGSTLHAAEEAEKAEAEEAEEEGGVQRRAEAVEKPAPDSPPPSVAAAAPAAAAPAPPNVGLLPRNSVRSTIHARRRDYSFSYGPGSTPWAAVGAAAALAGGGGSSKEALAFLDYDDEDL